MSSAAPSAVGTPSGSVQAPAAEPTPAPAAQPEAKRQIKPIPPKASAEPASDKSDGGESKAAGEGKPAKEVLPGVVTGGDIELPVRGPDGRFMSRAAAEAAFEAELRGEEGEPEPEAEPAAPEPERKKPDLPGKPGDQKIQFLGKEMTVAEAEQLHRTLRGMHDPIAKKLAATEKDRDYGYQAANAWEQEAKNARAELEQLKAQAGGQAGKGAPQSGVVQAGGEMNLDGLVDAIDYDAFELIAHDPQGGTRVAGRYLAQQLLGTVLNQIIPALKAEMAAQVQPLQMTAEQARTANEVQGVIEQVASYNTLEGNAAFPELQDADALREIGAVWHDSMPAGVDPKAWARAAMSPQGLINAIALYRMLRALPAEAAPAPLPAAPAEVAPGAAALAEADDTGQRVGMGRPARDAGPDNSFARQLRASFEEPLFDRTLGFPRNRRS